MFGQDKSIKKTLKPFSEYIKDIALNEFFYEEVTTEFDIFRMVYKLTKLPQEEHLETSCIDKRCTKLQISL